MKKNKYFTKDIVIHSQSVRSINYFKMPWEKSIDKEFISFNHSFEYDIFNNNENERDHIILLELSLTSEEETNSEEISKGFSIIVEGHYSVSEDIEIDRTESIKHIASLGCLISFLRSTVFAITSAINNGGYNLPVIDIRELHKLYFKKNKSPQK